MRSAGGPGMHWLPPCCIFFELEAELELLGSRCNADLTDN
jgi:hypothetical protein